MLFLFETELQTDLYDWADRNPSPANLMIIAGPKELEALAPTLYGLQNEGYGIFLAYPQRPARHWESFLCGVCEEWLWTSLLEGVFPYPLSHTDLE